MKSYQAPSVGCGSALLPPHGGSFPCHPPHRLENLFKVCVSKVMDGSRFSPASQRVLSANKMRGDVTERRSPAGASDIKAHQAAADPGLDAPDREVALSRIDPQGSKDRVSTTMPALSKKYPNDMGRNKTPEELRSRHYLRTRKGAASLRPHQCIAM